MKIRPFIATAGIVAGLSLAACGPPQTNGHIQKPVPACTATVTVINEGDPLPCLPGPGQRLDVIIKIAGNLDAAVAKCYGMGGFPQTPNYDLDQIICRQVTV